MEYLRGKTIACPKIPEDQTKSFENLVEYLGLSSEICPAEIVPAEIMPPEKFDLHSTGVTLQEGGIVAIHDSTRSHKYVLGENVYQQGIVRRQLKIESFHNDWMMVGVAKGDVVPQNNQSHSWPGSYGWTAEALVYYGRMGHIRMKVPLRI